MEMGDRSGAKTVALPLQKTLKALRRSLQAAGISVLEEIDLGPRAGMRGKPVRRSVLLLVDCPLLFFEAVALDRAAGLFFPLHVIVSGDDSESCIRWAHPAAAAGSRPPATVRGPLNALHQRVTDLLANPRWQRLGI